MLDEHHLDRALWRSRRGMLELDLLLVDFARRRYAGLNQADQAAYQRLLEQDDWVIWDWLQRQVPPAAAYDRIVELVRAFNESADDA